MDVLGFDHIVISARKVQTTLDFYRQVLGLEVREERPQKWALHFGTSKISVQDAAKLPVIAGQTRPGTANFCLYTKTPMAELITHLTAHNIEIVAGPDERLGATGPIHSVYFYDPDGNLVEICNRLDI